jgi:hypothetical protein
MNGDQSPTRVVVRRITVDERLADDLIRLVVCRLRDGIEAFFDRRGDWGLERESFARPKDYARKLGVSPDGAPPWETLEEGQLFLAGEFEIVGDRASPHYFRICPGKQEFLRLDLLDEYKEGVKRLYSVLLTGGQEDGQPH